MLAMPALVASYFYMSQGTASVIHFEPSGIESSLIDSEEIEHILSSDTLPDFTQVGDIKTRKYLFFEYMYRRTKIVNDQLQEVALELVEIKQGGISDSEAERITELAEQYKIVVKDDQYKPALDELLKRVKPIPPSLVLAQAAAESGWGTSRFARQAYNLFGHWCYSKGCGLVPKQRKDDASHEVRVFERPLHSVSAYIHNLNSSRAYRELRKIRQANPDARGIQLAKGLRSYSQRGDAYVRDIQGIIKQNNLLDYDKNYFE